jgi:hypothetical protein
VLTGQRNGDIELDECNGGGSTAWTSADPPAQLRSEAKKIGNAAAGVVHDEIPQPQPRPPLPPAV